jgi:glycosyltransferase involved in cell wall biosynthesis
MKNNLSILCVHQGYELYGSDKMFLKSVNAIKATYPDASITVHIPHDGRLSDHLIKHVDNVVTGNLFILRRGALKLKKLFLLAKNTQYCFKLSNNHSVVYINTSVVLPYILLSRFSKKRYILHIHEIPYGISKIYFYFILKWTNAEIILNSYNTGQHLPVKKNHVVIYNGIDDRHAPHGKELHALNILLVGRINSWKGQLLAVKALSQLLSNIHLRIIGSYFEKNDKPYQQLLTEIRILGLESRVTILDFQENLDDHYRWAHLALVPSIKPEPFGLVAIEAMSHELPVIAAGHGGLVEIVIPDTTGILFEPNSVSSLVNAISQYISNPALIKQHGQNGRERFLKYFQTHHYTSNFQRFLESSHE